MAFETTMIKLTTINTMSEEDFVRAFGDVAEKSPWLARGAMFHRPYTNREAMILAFERALDDAPKAAQTLLIKMHPDLATKAKLTKASRLEQRGAGLNALTEYEFAHLSDLNTRYKAKFGFPFIYAVKGASKHDILQSFDARIKNTATKEFAMALTQIKRIFRFRLEDRVQA
jgi:2-oxo-4-hydroxy-4-carboxy-5-ureidoimidazoline decarboxylase